MQVDPASQYSLKVKIPVSDPNSLSLTYVTHECLEIIETFPIAPTYSIVAPNSNSVHFIWQDDASTKSDAIDIE